MKDLGKSVECYKNGGAKFGFYASIVIVVLFIGLLIFVELDAMGKTMNFFVTAVFIGVSIYMYFKSKTEMDLREHGICVQTLGKRHEILYSEIAKLDKTKRVGKSGNVIIIFYLLVFETSDGKRVVSPCRVTEEFLEKFIELSNSSLNNSEA